MVRFRNIAATLIVGGCLVSTGLFAPSVLQPGGLNQAMASLLTRGVEQLGLTDGLDEPAANPQPNTLACADGIQPEVAFSHVTDRAFAVPADFRFSTNTTPLHPEFPAQPALAKSGRVVCVVTVCSLGSGESATFRRLPPPIKS